jgi:hypothetical protein
MEKLTAVDLLLMMPFVKAMADKNGSLSPLYDDLYKKLNNEIKSRHLAVVESAIKTITAYEPRAAASSLPILELISLSKSAGIKTLNDDE